MLDPSSPIHFARAQNTSSLVLLLPMLERENDFRQLPKATSAVRLLYDDFYGGNPPYVWIGDDPSVAQLARTPVPVFFCPSDNLDMGIQPGKAALITSQPAFVADGMGAGGPSDAYFNHFVESDGTFYGTNYLGCAGPHSGGNQPNSELLRFTGVMSCRHPISFNKIKDGASNTIMYGETIGSIYDQVRSGAFVWCFGGVSTGAWFMGLDGGRID